MKIILPILFLILLIVACEDDKIMEGIVFKKEFRPATTGYKKEDRIKTNIRRGGVNHIKYSVTYKVSYPKRWIVYVHSVDEKDTAEFFVHKDIYDSINLHSWFMFDTTKGSFKEPYKIIK